MVSLNGHIPMPAALCAMAVAWLALLWPLPTSAQTPAGQAAPVAPAAHFRALSNGAALPLGPQLLSAAEQDFIAKLPVVRVAVPMPPNRPYEDVNAAGEVFGIHPDMLAALGKAFGVRMQPVIYPSWSAAWAAAKTRDVDLLMTLGVTAERLQHMEFTLGATPSPAALFGRIGAPPVELDQARYALQRDYIANDYVRRQYPLASIVPVATTAEALQAVAAGQADYYLGSLLEATERISREKLTGIEARQLLSYATGHFHFAVRKDWAPLASILNRGIQALRSKPSGELAAAFDALPAHMRPALPLQLPEGEAAVLAQRPVWRVGAVRGLTLLNDYDAKLGHTGIAAEYTEQVARKLGAAIQVIPFDSVAELLAALRSGHIDLTPFLTRTPQRALEFDFSAPYVEMPYVLVTRSDATLYWSLASLNGKRLAMAKEHPLRALVAQHYPRIVVVDVGPGTAAMDAVAKGEADAAVDVKLFANLRINADNDGHLRVAAVVEELPAQFHFAASKTRADLLPLVNRALADISEAERSRMQRRWVAMDLQPGFAWRRWLPLMATAAVALLLIALTTLWWMRRMRTEVLARRRSEELLNDIALTVPGVAFRYVLHSDGSLRQRFITPGARAFFGLELSGEGSFLSLLAPHLRTEHARQALALEQASLASGEPFEATVAFQPPGRVERWLTAKAVQTHTRRGERVWTGYVVDVSNERRLQDRLVFEARSRNLLLATASHELRAPTHSLSLALQSISTSTLASSEQAAVRIAKRSADTLTQLLNDVLDAAQLDTGPLRLRPVVFDLHALLQELQETWAAAAKDKALGFELQAGAEVPQLLNHDPLRLKQVLTNLLSNAIKYTAQGHIALHVSAHPQALRFAVADTGAGISPADQARLFKPYATVDEGTAAATQDKQGDLANASNPLGAQASTGLGLLMARQVAQSMGGDIALHSERGVGSCFTFTLPLLAMPAAAAPAAPASQALQTLGNGTVLVCDDDALSRMLSVQMLRLRGFDVLEASDGAMALATLQSRSVAALITDLDMPVLGGRELITGLRLLDRERGTHTVVVVCSGSPAATFDMSSSGAADAANKQGPAHDLYMVKPVQLDTLVLALAEHGVKPPAAVV